MPKLVNLLNKNKLTVIVTLPENSLELAQAALDGGADALQLIVKDDLKTAEKIIAKVKAPVGLSIGPKVAANEAKLAELSKWGADYLSVDIKSFSSFSAKAKKITKVLALNEQFSYDELIEISRLGAEAIDAAIIPLVGVGKEMVVGDLQNYISIVLSAGVPVIIPTQRCLKPSEVAIISDTGAKGLLLTPVVTGCSAEHLRKNIGEFKLAADELSV